jgi:hypothetical protein
MPPPRTRPALPEQQPKEQQPQQPFEVPQLRTMSLINMQGEDLPIRPFGIHDRSNSGHYCPWALGGTLLSELGDWDLRMLVLWLPLALRKHA